MQDQPTTAIVRKRYTLAEKQRILEDYGQSGMTQRDFVQHAGISISALHLWLKKSKTSTPESTTTQFLPIANLLGGGQSLPCYRIKLGGRVCVEIPPGFRPQELKALLEAAAQL